MKKILSMWPFAVSAAMFGLYMFLRANDEWLISKIVLTVASAVFIGFGVYFLGDLIRYVVTKHGDNDHGTDNG